MGKNERSGSAAAEVAVIKAAVVVVVHGKRKETSKGKKTQTSIQTERRETGNDFAWFTYFMLYSI